jgi:hypothetical protein
LPGDENLQGFTFVVDGTAEIMTPPKIFITTLSG